jgi:ferredoxin--NADP+ reductase
MSSPLRIAIVGAGPAGAYAAGALLGQDRHPIEVDVYERLPTPWGLVRAGVAPDHPKIKTVTRVFEKTADLPGFQLLANVEVGRDVSHDELMQWYDAVVYASGTERDRRLGIPGEDLPGSLPATAFVAWYNAHPDWHELPVDLDIDHALVVGNGNVAVDCARMLALRPHELTTTDTADHAIATLSSGAVREVTMIGRRGPLQAAFTNPELRELGELEDVDLVVDPEDLHVDDADFAAADITHQRNVEMLREYATRTPAGAARRLALRFCTVPVEILGDGKVEAVVLERTELVRTDDGRVSARPTGQREELPVGLVLRSIGYYGTPIEGLPFDEHRGIVPNEAGRVEGDAGPLTGVYVTGWIKRGPSGVIGTNKKDANETVSSLLEDLDAARLPTDVERPSAEEVCERLRERIEHLVELHRWRTIDAHEQELGRPDGRPRVKLATREHLLGVQEPTAR